MATANLTPERLKHWVTYDPDTGVFVRRVTSKMMKAGAVAGSLHHQGYLFFHVEGKMYAAHRLAWFYVHGVWPTGEIDHIDGQRANNRIANLRDVSRLTNIQNIRRSKSEVMGVRERTRGRFQARISIDGKLINIGSFGSAELAHAAYLDAKRRLHVGFAG